MVLPIKKLGRKQNSRKSKSCPESKIAANRAPVSIAAFIVSSHSGRAGKRPVFAMAVASSFSGGAGRQAGRVSYAGVRWKRAGRKRTLRAMLDVTSPPAESADYATVKRAIEFISTRWRDQPSIEAIAGHVGLSASHFQHRLQALGRADAEGVPAGDHHRARARTSAQFGDRARRGL